MDISIIVPAYNAADYITECLESVLAQEHADMEVIVVDDGSTDGTTALLRSMAVNEPRLRVIRQANTGVSAARNHGLREARGEYVMFVDADDALAPDAVATLLELASQADADVAMGAIYRSPAPPRRRGRAWVADGRAMIERALYQRGREDSECSLNSVWGKLWHRRLFEWLSFREGIRYEDLDLCYRLYDKSKKVAGTSMPVYYYRDNGASFLSNFSDQRLDVLDVTAEMEKYMKRKHPELLPAAQERSFSAACNMLILCRQHGRDDLAERCLKIIKERRRGSLLNPRVRLKSHIGAALSYLGPNVLTAVGKAFYR